MSNKGFKKRIKLQLKFSLAVILLIISSYWVMSRFIIAHEERSLSLEVKKRIVTQARNLAKSSQKLLLQEDPEFFLCPLVQRIMDEDRDVLYAVVVDAEDKIKGINRLEKIDSYYKQPLALAPEEDDFLRKEERLEKNRQLFHISIPIYQQGIKIGAVYLGFSRAGINQAIEGSLNKIRVITLVIMLLGIIASSLLVSFIVRPIKALARGAEQIGKGDFDYSVPVRTRDEIGELTEAFNQMAKSLKEKRTLRHTFDRYVTKEIADIILQDMDNIRLGGERRPTTTLFADIHGFTQMSEGMKPEEVVELLNEYFTLMTDIIFKYEGTLDKFMGDALLAVYGAPIAHEDDSLRAVKTAIEMMQSLHQFNQKRLVQGYEPIQIGIAITTGEVIVGNVGSEKRMEYTVIGDSVNLVARLEELTKDGQIFLDTPTYTRVAGLIRVRRFKPIKIKGINNPVEIYEVIELK